MDYQTILAIVASFATLDRPIYLVGGSVRDRILGRDVHDLDFVLPGKTRGVARRVADQVHGAFYVMDEERDTTRVVVRDGVVLDFSSMRGDTLEDDLRARDFSINAIAVDVTNLDALIDPLGGMQDLTERRIRVCGPTSLKDDPMRVLRCARLSIELQFHIDPHTLALAHKAAGSIARVSAERQRDELFKMLESRDVSAAVGLLDDMGALVPVLPELVRLKGVEQSAPHVYEVWKHTLEVVRLLESLLRALCEEDPEVEAQALPWTLDLAVDDLGKYRQQITEHLSVELAGERSVRGLLFLAALYHDAAKPEARQVEENGRARFFDHENLGADVIVARAKSLTLSNDEVERLRKIVSGHMRVHFMVANGATPSDKTIYRFYRDTGEGGIDVCLLSLADVLGTYGDTLPEDVWRDELTCCRKLFDARWEQVEVLVNPPRLVGGDDLIRELGMKPGPLFGQVLEAIREAQVEGLVTSREDALKFVRRWISAKDGAL